AADHLVPGADERRHACLDVRLAVRCGELHPDAGLPARDHREAERGHVHTPFEHRVATFVASAASPNITGTIACSPSRSSKPASVICRRKEAAFAHSFSRSSPAPPARSRAVSVAATIAGARELENR